MKRIQYSITCILLTLCVLFCGCPSNNPNYPDSTATQTEPGSDTPPQLDLVIQDEAPLPTSALSQLPSVQETLEKMIRAYKELDSYTDQAFCQVTIRQGENISNQSLPFYFSYVKPNKMRYTSRTCEIRSNGKTISVYNPALPGVILQKPCPEELHLEDVLFDQTIDEAVFMSQPSLFSVLPLQWIMLFVDDPLKTLTFGQKEIRSLAPQEINGRLCYRLRFDREDGAAILWIDQKTGLILRAQLPTQALVNSVEGASANDCSLTMEFGAPQINEPIPDAAFAMEIPVGTNVTDKYIPPTTKLLGTKAPDFQFNKLDNGGTVDSSAVNDKIAVINFWTTWSKLEPSIQPQLNLLRKKYEDDKDVVFLSVSTDDESAVSDAALRDALKQWGSPLDCVRDVNGYLSQELKINAVPAVFVLNKNGEIEYLEMGFNPLLVNEISDCIDQIKQGESPCKTTIKNKQAETQQYEQRRKEWLKRGIFVDADIIAQAGIPETTPAQTSQPRQFELKLLWETNGIQNPGGLLVVEGSRQEAVGSSNSPAANLNTASAGCVWVIENGKKVVQIDSEGHIKSRIDLDLNPKEICSFIRKSSTAIQEGSRQEAVGSSEDASKRPTGADIGSRAAARTGSGASPPCFLAFAPGQQRIHVYDQNWKILFHYPENALENPHDGIQDVRFGDLDNKNQDEIYIGYLGTSGAQSIDLNGRLRWRNRTLGTVFSIAPYHGQNENLILCCAGSSGMITVLKADGKTMGDKNNVGVIGLKDNLAAMVYSAKIKDASLNDSLCALCANQNAYMLVGFNLRSEILWTYELPQGIPKRPIDYLTSADVLPNGDSIWIALGSDGSVHFIDSDGVLIDSFNYGAYVYGLAVANWNGKRVLILSDDQGVKAYEIIWK